MKLLFLDIETSPYTAYIWQLKQYGWINPDSIIDTASILCWSAKWHGEEETFFNSCYKTSPKKMLQGIYDLIEKADVLVHFNGSKFDIPILNREFLLYGLTPPAPYQQIDLLKTIKSQFKFPSNSLNYISKSFGLGQKISHKGLSLWKDCMVGDPEAWKVMEEYNKQDVILLEKIYDKVKPWIKKHPNVSLYTHTLVCPNCGSNDYQKRGFSYTQSSQYQRYKCSECGSWFKDGHNLAEKIGGKFNNA